MKKILLLPLLALFTVAACGQKGPLYLENDQAVVDAESTEVEENNEQEGEEETTEENSD